MGKAETSSKKKRLSRTKKREIPRTNKTEVVVIGLVLAIVGSIIAGSYEKDTLTNFAGFGMLLAGVATCVLGICATAITSLNTRLTQQTPAISKAKKPKMLCPSIWAIGIGMILTIIGSVLGSASPKDSMINTAGFAMMLTGICVSVLGAFGAALGLLKIELNKKKNK
jgi:predicted cation transporter